MQLVDDKLKFTRDDHDSFDTGLSHAAVSSKRKQLQQQAITKVQLENVFEEFLDCEEEDEIRFACGFDNIERALVHRIANNWDLKHVSFGCGEGRYIVISKRW